MLGNSLKGSASSLLSVHSISEFGDEKPQLPRGNIEPLNARKMSNSAWLTTQNAYCKVVQTHTRFTSGFREICKSNFKKQNLFHLTVGPYQLLFLSNKLLVPSVLDFKNKSSVLQGLHPAESQFSTLGYTGKASEGFGPVSVV